MDLALADEGAARSAVAAPFVLLEDDAEAVGLRKFECDVQLGAFRAAPEGIGDFPRPELLMRGVASVEHIPVARAVGEVVDECGRFGSELGVRLLDLVSSVRVEKAAEVLLLSFTV